MNSCLYVVGGWDGQSYLSSVERCGFAARFARGLGRRKGLRVPTQSGRYDPRVGKWSLEAPMGRER